MQGRPLPEQCCTPSKLLASLSSAQLEQDTASSAAAVHDSPCPAEYHARGTWREEQLQTHLRTEGQLKSLCCVHKRLQARRCKQHSQSQNQQAPAVRFSNPITLYSCIEQRKVAPDRQRAAAVPCRIVTLSRLAERLRVAFSQAAMTARTCRLADPVFRGRDHAQPFAVSTVGKVQGRGCKLPERAPVLF